MTEEERLELYKKLTPKEKFWIKQMELMIKFIYAAMFFSLGIVVTLYYIKYNIDTEKIFNTKHWNCMQELEEDVEQSQRNS